MIHILKAIIFDFDGVLVNSQPLHYQAYKRVLASYGHDLSLTDWRMWVENSLGIRKYLDRKDICLSLQQIRRAKRELFNKLIPEIEFMPGAEKAIKGLAKHFSLGIASASDLESIERILTTLAVKDIFKVIVSDKDLKRRKPYPDVFLKTAELLGITPTECLVIEDSPAGLKAAQQAGMKCIIVPDRFTCSNRNIFKDADLILDSLEELSKFVLDSA